MINTDQLVRISQKMEPRSSKSPMKYPSLSPNIGMKCGWGKCDTCTSQRQNFKLKEENYL